MDVFATGDTGNGMTLDARVGGSPFNVAVGLARLGQPVGFVGAISRDFLGDRLVRALSDEEIDIKCVTRVPHPTTLALVGTDPHGVPSYVFHGDRGADRQLGAQAFDQLPRGLTALHMGSFSTVVEPAANAMRDAVNRLQAETLISYDPNLRLNVEPRFDRWRDMFDWMVRRAHLLKISEEDLALLMPTTDIDQFCKAVLSQGVLVVVVTRGAAGALARTVSLSVEVPAVKVRIIDTVGAGDAFQAAFLAYLAEQDYLGTAALADLDEIHLRASLTFAARAAAITCSRRGADLPFRTELSA